MAFQGEHWVSTGTGTDTLLGWALHDPEGICVSWAGVSDVALHRITREASKPHTVCI